MGTIITPLEKVGDQMKATKSKFWWVRDSDNCELGEQTDVSESVEGSFDKLREFVGALEGDYVKVIVRNKAPNLNTAGEYEKKGGSKPYEYRVRVGIQTGAGGQQVSGFGGSGMNNGIFGMFLELNSKLEAEKTARIQDQLNTKIADLEKQLKEGDRGKMPMLERLIEGWAKEMVSANAGGFKKPTMTIERNIDAPVQQEAAPAERTPEQSAELQHKVEEAITKINKFMGKDAIDFYLGLAKLTEAQPEVFRQQAEEMIIPFAKTA